MKIFSDSFLNEGWEEVDKQWEIGEKEKEIETLLERLEGAINSDLRVALAKDIKAALELLEKDVGIRGVEDYYRRLNGALGETLDESSLPEEDSEKDKLPEEVIIEGRKRLRAVVKIDRLFEELDEKLYPDGPEVAKEIREELGKNRKVLEREDGSGAEEVNNYYRRLEKIESQFEDQRREAVIITLENMFGWMEDQRKKKVREQQAVEIENFLDRNEEVILRSDKSGINDLRNFRLRLDNLVPRRKAKEKAA